MSLPLAKTGLCASSRAASKLVRQSMVPKLSLLRPALSGPCRCANTRPKVARRLLGRVASGATATADTSTGSGSIPDPVVKMDNISDPFATVVSVEFGDRLGELLDTMTALKNLGLNIRRAKLDQSSEEGNRNTFYITDATTSEKVLRSARLEEIRMTIINNMMRYHPESAERFSAGRASTPMSTIDITNPLGPRKRSSTMTTIEVRDAPNGSCSILLVKTSDRPGLLVDIVSVLKDINVNVVSAEVDTIGSLARDEFFVTYHGEPLTPPMVQLVTNALQYYLSLAEVAKEESY